MKNFDRLTYYQKWKYIIAHIIYIPVSSINIISHEVADIMDCIVDGLRNTLVRWIEK